MKTKLLTFIMALCLIVPTALMATACDENPNDKHTHTYETKYNDTYHWSESTCEHAVETNDKTAHTFENGECSVCDYVYDVQGTGEIVKVATAQELADAVANAEDDDVIVLASGTYAFEELQTLTVNKRLTFFGEGVQGAKLSNVIFSVGNSTSSHKMETLFNNLAFIGVSQIQLNDLDHVDAEIVGLDVTDLTIKNCVAEVDNTTISTNSHSKKGQFLSLSASYDLLLNLVVEDNVFVTSHTISDEDSSPIVYANGTLIKNATFKNNTFGSTEKQVYRYAVKFGRRTDDTTITFDNNVVYGATTESKDFYLLDLWQSGSNAYDNLQITISNNNIVGTPDAERTLSYAYIESTVVEKTAGELGSLTLLNNTVNDQAIDETNIKNSANIQIAQE